MRPASTRSSLIHGAPIHAGSVRALPRTTAPSAPPAVEATRSPWFTRPVTATLRTAHPTARLVWTGDFANYSGDFSATVAGEPMPTAAAANSWCDAQALDADHCCAVRLTHSGGPEAFNAAPSPVGASLQRIPLARR